MSTADAICCLIARTGISAPIKTMVSSLVNMSRAEFACPVDRLPSCPVFMAVSISIAAASLTSPTIIREGLILRLVLIRSLMLTAFSPSTFALLASRLTRLSMPAS